MKEPNRREQAAEEARNRILVAAADCIVRDGLASIRMAAIARAAGVSSGLLHYHFATKDQLLVEVLRHSSEASHELTERALERSGRAPAGRLSLLLDRCLPSDDQLARDWRLWQELDLLCLRQPDLAHVGAEVYETIYASVAEILDAGIADGIFDLDHDLTREAAESAVALCDGIGARVVGPDDLSLEQARARVALAVGRLVGHDGPLPLPDQALRASA